MTLPPKITILLADDHPATREGIRTLLSQAEDMEIIGEAENGFEVLDLVDKLRPQVLLLDLVMPGPRAFEIEAQVREHHPDTITLVLTSHNRDAYLAAMMDAGAVGYLGKDTGAERLIEAIRRAANGVSLFDAEQYARAQKWREEVGEKIKQLTKREIEILKLLANGLDNGQIAHELGISSKTAAFHITHILSKLQVNSRLEAALWGTKHLFDNLE